MNFSRNSFPQDLLNDPDRGAVQLVERYRAPLYAVAISLCHDHMAAEDLVFRTLERAIQRVADCRDETAFLEWLKAILRNEWRMSVRRGMTRATTPEGGPDDIERLVGPGATGDDVVREVDGDLVREAIDTLSPESREVLIQHYFLDMPLDQIARFLRLPVGTVKSRLHYARIALAARLRPHGRGVAALLVALLLFGVGSWAAVVGGRAALVAAGLLKPASSAETEIPESPPASGSDESPADVSLPLPSPDGCRFKDRSSTAAPSGGAAVSSLFFVPSLETSETTQTMKTSPMLPVVAFAALSPLTAMSDDYVLPAGQTDTMSSSVTYGTMTISGDLTVNGGATVSASETTLGGDSGDSAGIIVSDSNTKFDSQKVTIGGTSGGTGKITATQGGVVVIGKTANDANLLTVASGAVPADGDVIDVLELGAGTHSISRLSNASAHPARIRFVEPGAKFSVRSGSSTQWKTSFASGSWILDADSPAEIRLDCPPNHYLTAASASLSTTGSGSFHVVGGSMTYNAALTFGNTGGLVIDTGYTFGLMKDKADLSGLRGPLTINGTLNAANNAVYGDGLVVGANGAVKTSATQDFVFGSGDADGSLSATIPSSNRVAKVGSGTLTVTGASSAGRLTISDGTVKVSAAFTVGTLELEEGATLIVDDGVDFAPGAVVENGAATIATLGTGRFILNSDSSDAIARPSLEGSFVKAGSGTTTIYAPQSMPDTIHVTEGGVVFSAYGLPQKFLRWTFSKTVSSPNPLHIARLWVFGSDGGRVVTGLVEAIENDNTAASSIRAGRVAWEYSSATNIAASSSQWFYGKGLLHKVFNKDFTTDHNHYPHLTSPVVDPGNSDSWIGFTVHRKSGEANATGYNIEIGNYANAPSSWTVEASDDGETWTRVDVRENLTPASTTAETLYDGETAAEAQTRGAPLQHFLFSGYVSGGLAADAAKAVTLQVDEGASVDLTAFTESPQKIDGLVVDFAAGGGTVEGGAIAPGGTLCILNGAQGFAFGAALPITLSGVTDADNLDDWSIVIDGVGSKGRVKLDADGHPVVVPFGTVVFFR